MADKIRLVELGNFFCNDFLESLSIQIKCSIIDLDDIQEHLENCSICQNKYKPYIESLPLHIKGFISILGIPT